MREETRPLESPKMARRSRALQEIRLCGLPRRVKVATAAAMLDVSENHLRELVHRGILPEPTQWPDGYTGFRAADLEAFILGLPPDDTVGAQSPSALRSATRCSSQVV